ncbi:MAG: hypothetical protein H7Y31_06285, partial [Chitinophagaceae bacterium]|nr:hypothetical protein [Chitinophagaceae bacterium]
RCAISKPLVFERPGDTIIFSLVKFDKTTSYQSNGGFVRKSVATSYSIQSNRVSSGEKILETKVKEHGDVKTFPIELMGSTDSIAWLFAGELLGFNPFTHQLVADPTKLENLNERLRGKLMNERKYYDFNEATGTIEITAKDGNKYNLDPRTLIVALVDDEAADDIRKSRQKRIEKELKLIQQRSDMLFARYRNFNKQYSVHSISMGAFRDSMETFQQKRKLLDKIRDSIYTVQRDFDEITRHYADRDRAIESIQRNNPNFSSIKTNGDTFNLKWFGLYNPEDLADIPQRFDYRNLYNEAARNRLYTTGITIQDSSKRFPELLLGEEKRRIGNEVFLQGGFLIDRKTGRPIHLHSPDRLIIVHKDQVGREGLIQVSAISTNGKIIWTHNTRLKEFSDWQLTNQYLVITGGDKKELSSGENNVLLSVRLSDGNTVRHDFFKM